MVALLIADVWDDLLDVRPTDGKCRVARLPMKALIIQRSRRLVRKVKWMRIDERDCGMGVTSVKQGVRPVGALWRIMRDGLQGHRRRRPWLSQAGPLAHAIHTSLWAVDDESHSGVNATAGCPPSLSNLAMRRSTRASHRKLANPRCGEGGTARKQQAAPGRADDRPSAFSCLARKPIIRAAAVGSTSSLYSVPADVIHQDQDPDCRR